MARRTYYVVGLPAKGIKPAVPYGYSSSQVEAAAALARGYNRGAKWAEIWTRTSAPRGLDADDWLPPFESRKLGS